MDLGTILGVLAGLGAIYYIVLHEGGGDVAAYINFGAMILIVGGSIGAALIAFPFRNFLSLGKIFVLLFREKRARHGEVIRTFGDLAGKARKEGMLALQGSMESISDPFFKQGLQLIVDGQDAEVVEAILAGEIEAMEARHRVGADILTIMGSMGPAFGIIGTVIGLINMLRNMEDPSNVGPAMAVAFIATLYGAIYANAFVLPMANKLKRKSADEAEGKKLILAGLLAIQSGDNPRVLVRKLSALVAPRERVGEDEAA